MRFVSDKRGLSITVVGGTPEVRDPASGAVTRSGVPDVEAKFSHDLLDEEAINIAKLPRSQGGLANTDRRSDGTMPDSPFRGQQQDESGKFLPIEARLAVFDSEVASLQYGWSAETRERVEQELLTHAFRGNLYQLVESAAAGLPWNGYDSVTDPEQVIYIAGLTNTDLNLVLSYEKANANRPEFVEALVKEIVMLGEAEVVVNA
ncbi:MAG: hypothetical protein OEV29_12420 [Thermoleophilia bacterium]|nr:hypothetical protein [Thermoleophilia bacterium]